jgi:hypothetical protein
MKKKKIDFFFFRHLMNSIQPVFHMNHNDFKMNTDDYFFVKILLFIYEI